MCNSILANDYGTFNLNYVCSSVFFIAGILRFSEKWRQSWTIEIVYMVLPPEKQFRVPPDRTNPSS